MKAGLLDNPLSPLPFYTECLSTRGFDFSRRLAPQALKPQVDDVPIWPAEYADGSPEAAWRFICHLRTWNEAEQAVQPFPQQEYLRAYAFEWVGCRDEGRTLITEKCRRMVVSWLARGLELWAMGLRRTDCILVGEDLEAAAKHVWRIQFLYDDLCARHPEWKLPAASSLRYEGARKLKMFGLANGSVTNYANGADGTLRGDGTAIITMEEAGTYRYLSSILAQAKIITQGSAGHNGGFVNLITNTSASYEWQRVKAS